MCRDKDHGGRRCPNDGSMGRRLRRQNAKKKVEFADEVIEPAEPQFIETPVEETITAESVRKLADEYNEIRKNCNTPKDHTDHYHHKHELSDAEILAEQKLIELGAAVTELSYSHGAPSEEEWEEYNSVREAKEQALLDDIKKDYQEILDLINSPEYTKLRISGPLKLAPGQEDKVPGERWLTYESSMGGKEVRTKEDRVFQEVKHMGGLLKQWDKANRLIDMRNAAAKKRNDFITETADSDYDELIERRKQGYIKALEEVGVEFAKPEDIDFKPARNKGMNEAFVRSTTLYPKSWVDNSTKQGKITFSVRKGRAHYNHNEAKIQVDSDDKESIITHELAHRFEHSNPEIGDAERAFLYRRTGMLAHQQREADTYQGAYKRGKDEYMYADNFPVDYVGKVYSYGKTYAPDRGREFNKGDASYEVLSMGVESVFYGEHGGGMGKHNRKKDPELNNFVVGLIASTAKK